MGVPGAMFVDFEFPGSSYKPSNRFTAELAEDGEMDQCTDVLTSSPKPKTFQDSSAKDVKQIRARFQNGSIGSALSAVRRIGGLG